MPCTYRLHHHPLDPPSRRVRAALAEKKIAFDAIVEKPWAPSPDLVALTGAGDVPVLVVTYEDGASYPLAEAGAICEYLEESIPQPSLLGGDDLLTHAETRRLVHWFETRMFAECTSLIVGEKALKRLQGGGEPDSGLLRAGLQNLHPHLEYIGWLAQNRNWLAGDALSLADLAAATQISVIDYLNDVPWDRHPNVKEWYARIKSRPSFRALLGDHIPGLMPPKAYADLDF